MQGKSVGSALLVAAVILATTAGSAPAATTCSFKAAEHRLTIEIGNGDLANVSVVGGEIVVHKDPGPAVSCSGPVPAAANTDRVRIVDVSPAGSSSVHIIDPFGFGPGFSGAGGDGGAKTKEIEFHVALGAGKADSLYVGGSSGVDRIRLGKLGINPNAAASEVAPDADITHSGVEELGVGGGLGADTLDGQGGAGTGAPFARPLRLDGMGGVDEINGGTKGDELIGQDGVDTIRGFGGNDEIDGGSGVDELHGGPGADLLEGGPEIDQLNGDGGADLLLGGGGADDFAGGAGIDTVSYADHPLGVGAVVGGPGSSGNASDGAPGNRDTIAEDVENLIGTDHPTDGDVLMGNDGDNLLDGDAGPDVLNGGGGVDTVTYASRDEGVTVSFLGPGAHQGGPLDGPENARDEFIMITNVVGSRGDDEMSAGGDFIDRVFKGGAGDDRLSGGNGDDTLVGGRGRDRLLGNLGIDILKAKDRVRDRRIDCGGGSNAQERATFDQGLDPQPVSC